jgi:predicted membrane channel-forming protein YqfA (hemolysin III family)
VRVFRSRPFVSGRSYKMDHSGNVSLATHTYTSIPLCILCFSLFYESYSPVWFAVFLPFSILTSFTLISSYNSAHSRKTEYSLSFSVSLSLSLCLLCSLFALLRLTLTPLNLKFEGILSNGFVLILVLVIWV